MLASNTVMLRRRFGIRALPLFLTLLLAATAPALALDGYDAALVIHDRASGKTTELDPALSDRRLPPCSTFKIYNTLIGLELGLIPDADAPWYRWDGVRRFLEDWNRDLTLREAFRVSAVPAYQVLARQIGAERMRAYIRKLDYGSRDISAGIDVFWLDRTDREPIRISAREQVALLDRLLDGKLPFADRHVATLKDIMTAVETDKGTLYGKTGSGMSADGKWSLGWYVGFVESGGAIRVFACNITGGETPSGRTARAIVEDIFRAQGLL